MRTLIALTRLALPLALAASFWLGCSSTNEDPADGHGGAGGFGGFSLTGTEAGSSGTGGGTAGGPAPAIDGGPLIIDGGIECHTQFGAAPVIVYAAPGCGAQQPEPICVGPVGACLHYACSCAGKVIIGCTVFSEPYAYTSCGSGSCALDAAPTVGADCDPNAH